MIRSFLFILYNVIWILPGYAQLSQDLEKVKAVHKNGSIQGFQVIYQGYENVNSLELLDSQTSVYIHEGYNTYYLSHHGQTTFRSGDRTLIVDEETKQVLLFSTPQVDESIYNFPLDSILKICSHIELLSNTGSHRTYRMNFYFPMEYSHVVLTLNTEQWVVEKLVLYYKSEVEILKEGKYTHVKPRVEIQYVPINLTDSDKQKLVIDRYVHHDGNNNYSLSKYYPDYELINLIQN